MKILRPGTEVTIQGQNGIRIVGVFISAGLTVRYECGWWSERTYNTGYFREHQMTIDEEKVPLDIGL